jgi:hypothetical protein
MSRFDYVKYDEKGNLSQHEFKTIVQVLESKIMNLGAMTTIQTLTKPGGDMQMVDRLIEAKKNAIKSLEETYMWIGKAIRDDQLARNGSAELQEERKDG